MRPGDSALVHEIRQIVGEALDGERALAPGRLSMAAGIHGQHAKVLCKERNLMDEVGRVLAVSVQQDQRFPRARLGTVQSDVHGLIPW